MRRYAIRGVAGAGLAAALLAACQEPSALAPAPTAASSSPATTETATATEQPTTAAPVEFGSPYPAPADTARVLPTGSMTVTSAEGHAFALAGVHRLAEDRVVIAGVLSLNPADDQSFRMNMFEEPELRSVSAGGSEFAPFRLTTADDDATYLPVRDAEDRCQCSVIRGGMDEQGEALTVMTVMSAPADATTVTLDMEGFGELADVPLAPISDGLTTPWGAKETLTVRGAERDRGALTLHVTLASPDDGTGWGYGVYGRTTDQLCLAGITATGTGARAGHVDGCVRGVLPPAGQAVDLEFTLPDPGTPTLVLLPSNGFPLPLTVEGDAVTGSGEHLIAYDSRSRTAGATIAEGDQIEVVLDTSVLFDYGESVLTPDAEATIAAAAQALQDQDGRSLSIAGHTDGQGGDDVNLPLSQARASAVRDALEARLGDAWSFEVHGYGSDRPVAEESGTPEEIATAQARNRRVEITVSP